MPSYTLESSTVSYSVPFCKPPSFLASFSSGFTVAQKGSVSASHLSIEGLKERCSLCCCLRAFLSLSLIDMFSIRPLSLGHEGKGE